MSTALAIASVSAILRDLLNNGIIDHDLTASVGDVIVSVLPPDKIVTDANERSQLNLFLYQVTPNTGWRNEGLPSRDRNGVRLSNPPLALDLHYVLSAYGARDLHSEILLGVGMQILHETPVLPRDAIRRALAPPTPVVGGGGLPPDLQQLFTSGLADQVEQIKIAPSGMTTEDIYRLWSAAQAHYRASAAYQVTVVLIQSSRTTKSGLPVARRNIYVTPFSQPLIERVLSQAKAGDAILDQPILAGYKLVVQGLNLSADDVELNIGGVTVSPDPAQVSPAQIIVALPAGLQPGLQGVQVIQPTLMGSPPVAHAGVESNVAPFLLRPLITSLLVTNVSGGGAGPRSATIIVSLSPPIGPTQRVFLLLNRINPPPPLSYNFPVQAPPILSPPLILSPAALVTQVAVPVSGMAPGTYIARVQVDGAESPLGTDSAGRYNSPQVAIP